MLDLHKMKSLREKLELTMDAAATKAGFSSRQQWYNIESGRRSDVSVSTLEKLAEALGVKAKDLLK